MPDQWVFSESRPIAPFRLSSGALAGVGFRTASDSAFDAGEPWCSTVEASTFRDEGFAPEFELTVDRRALAEEAGIDKDEATVTIVMSDPGMLRSVQLARWSLTDAPPRYAVPQDVLRSVSGSRGVTFRVCATPTRRLRASDGRATKPGQIVASKEFMLDIPEDKLGFPIETQPSEVFVRRGHPPETVWIVHWKTGTDFDRPVEECLTVWLNADHSERLMRLGGTDKVGNVLWSEIAIEICLEIAMVVLASDPAEHRNPRGLLAKIVDILHVGPRNAPRPTVVELSRKARLDTEGPGFFRARLQAAFKLGERIQSINFVGRT